MARTSFRMVLAAASVAVAFGPTAATAAVRFVDGACATSGTGASLTCGATGPFRTIGEGILAMAPGDTVNVRGAHGTFDGTYFESLQLQNGSAPLIGKAVACTASQRCVIQGCRAPACATDEVPIVRGMRLHSDWTDQGGGVFSRLMEATPQRDVLLERSDGSGPYDPYLLVESGLPMAYAGDSLTAPPDGTWSFHPATHRVYVNPSGSGNPATTLFVPYFSFNVVAAGPTAYLTLQHLVIEGSRAVGLDMGNPGAGIPGLILGNLQVRHWRNKGIGSHSATGIIIEDSVFEYGCRGQSFGTANGENCFGVRLFNAAGGVVRRTTVRHLGAAGQVRFSGGGSWPCSWCDPPWNDRTHTYASAAGLAFQIKQTAGFTFEDDLAEDCANGGYSIDVSRGVTVQRSRARRTRLCVAMSNFTPTDGCPSASLSQYCYNSGHVIRDNVCEDTGENDVGLCAMSIRGNDATRRHVGETRLAEVYNNMILRPGFGGICVNPDDTNPGDLLIAYNSIYGANTTPDANALARGIVVVAASNNVQVRNNVIDGVSDEGLVIGSGALAGSSYDGDVIGAGVATPVRWNASVGQGQPSGGTTGTLAAFTAANPLQEVHARSGSTVFTSTSDLHLRAGSVAIDAGVPVPTVSTDIDGDPRPQGVAPDAGADEFRLGGATTTSTSSSTTSTSTSTSSSTTRPPTTSTTSTSSTSTQPSTTSTSTTSTTQPSTTSTSTTSTSTQPSTTSTSTTSTTRPSTTSTSTTSTSTQPSTTSTSTTSTTRPSTTSTSTTSTSTTTTRPTTSSTSTSSSSTSTSSSTTTTLVVAGCGNGLVEAGEECDDGNREPLDGCDGDCVTEDMASTPSGTALSTSMEPPYDPIAATITSPTAGPLLIVETSSTIAPPDEFTFVARQVHVEAPRASTANPLMLTFTIDSALSGVPSDLSDLEVFRNRHLVGRCMVSGQRAIPDPCLSAREPHGHQVGLTLFTSTAGDWNFGATIRPDTRDRCLGGTELLLQDRPRRFMLRSNDTPQLIVGDGADIPGLIAQGGSLRVVAIGGDGFDTTYPLSSAGWELLRRKDPGYGVRYRDKGGPITAVVFKTTRQLLVKGSGQHLQQSLASDPAMVKIELQLGAYRYRLEFGGDPQQFKPNRKLMRKWSRRPPACAAQGFDHGAVGP